MATKKTTTYTIIGKGATKNPRIEKIISFLLESIESKKLDKSIRLSFDAFCQRLITYEDIEDGVKIFANKFPTHSEIQTACFLFARDCCKSGKSKLMPIFKTEGKSGVVYFKTYTLTDYTYCYALNEKTADKLDSQDAKTDNMGLILKYVKNHIEGVDLDALATAILALATSDSDKPATSDSDKPATSDSDKPATSDKPRFKFFKGKRK